MANRRADYQRLSALVRESNGSAKADAVASLRRLILEDVDYARGFFEDSLRRALRFISPTVGKKQDRPFTLAVEVRVSNGDPLVILGASFIPKLEDDLESLIDFFGEELLGLSKLKGYDSFLGYVAVNGKLLYPQN